MVAAPECRLPPAEEEPAQDLPLAPVADRPDSPPPGMRLLVAAPRPPVTVGFVVNLDNPTNITLDQLTYTRAEVCHLLQQAGPPITFVLNCTNCAREVRALPFNIPGRFLCSGCAALFQV